MDSQTRRRWSEAGALTSAGTVAATIFCCLPFASGVLGAGLAAAGARFAPFRSYLAALSVTFLGYAFYQAYR
ncbi:MAG: mercuric transporter MerT family protein, partial [Vicinamibacterales bacterium]